MRGFSTRFAPGILIVVHSLARLWVPHPQIFLDLFLFNGVALLLVVSIAEGKKSGDGVGRFALPGAVALWSCGSILSTYSEFVAKNPFSSNYANACYVAMYPFAFVGLQRAMQTGKKVTLVEILDGAILGIGLSAVGSAFLISPVLPHFRGDAVATFFAILFPIADLVLVALVFSFTLLSSFSQRSLLLCIGILVFAFADFLFLGMNIRGTYSLGSITDDLWLIGLAIVAEALRHPRSQRVQTQTLQPLFIAVTVLMCATLLAVINLRPQYLPHFVAIPAITTLLLAFARMTMALRAANSLGEERLLARTDELTGLPNRRKFLADLESVKTEKTNPSALLLMDLDGFKPINDRYGHETGDKILREVTKRFSRTIPQGSILARLGGDEFGLIIHGENESTLEIALALRATLSYPFVIDKEEIMIDVSIGHVMFDGNSNVLRRADLAMYQAKRERVGVWSEKN